MPKLAIYVPKKEMKLIDKWRKRINFSQVFMRALQKEIQQQTQKVKGGQDQWTRAAKYYRQMMTDSSQAVVDFGFDLGSRHVLDCQLSPETILRLHELSKREALTSQDFALIKSEIDGDREGIDRFLNDKGYDVNTFPIAREELCRGYVRGVADAWKKVCEKM